MEQVRNRECEYMGHLYKYKTAIPLRNRARSLSEIFLLARRVAYRMAVSCFTGVGNHTFSSPQVTFHLYVRESIFYKLC